ncbi:protein phosphatase 1 regulatory subunit 21 [Vanessa atalanta]|uniref:protein phosphatase 1 regulatory subunit 21 n=1 Tax=Vanessa atalanta TaxID=42275 RepID=UPI001FCE2BC3|nr:protein phosphatase 1 regulatory subunit 21 [Vanessa atalanta]
MEGLPSGDIQAKYQKLAAEYSKLRVHVKVLKKGVLDEQAKSNELREVLKDKEKSLRKGELEIDSLTFRNQQLTRRVSVLQDELDLLQNKLTKKSKSKGDEKQASTSQAPSLDSGLLQEELQKKIIENAQYASQLSDKTFEVSQLQASIEDYQKHINESESKYKCEIAKLKNKNQELQFALEEAQKDKLGVIAKPQTSSQAASCNGDFLSEGGSLVGSEDALSSVDDLNINDQLSTKAHTLEQENQKLRMEYELLEMENESLKLEISKHVSAAQKRRGETHDSGDFNSFSETSVDAGGVVSGLLGALACPLLLARELQQREERVATHFRRRLAAAAARADLLQGKTDHYLQECEILRLRFDVMEREKEEAAHTLQEKHNTISRLEEELQSTSRNYEQQLGVLTEHVAALNEHIARQHDRLQRSRDAASDVVTALADIKLPLYWVTCAVRSPFTRSPLSPHLNEKYGQRARTGNVPR